MYNPSYIPVNTERLPRNPLRASCLPIIDTGIHRLQIFRRHLPERILDNPGRVMFIAHHFYTVWYIKIPGCLDSKENTSFP